MGLGDHHAAKSLESHHSALVEPRWFGSHFRSQRRDLATLRDFAIASDRLFRSLPAGSSNDPSKL